MVTASKKSYIRSILGPLFLILACPPFAILMWYTNTHLQGSFITLIEKIREYGFFSFLLFVWKPVFWGSKAAWTMLALFMGFQLALMRFLPGKIFYGPVTPKGNVPEYKANGVLAFFTTIATFGFLSVVLKLFSPTIIYDHLGEIFGALNIFSLFFCFLLYLKGRFKPSSSDSSYTGNFLFDYYWGTELYPRFFGFDVKMFTNCRFALMSWPILLFSYMAKQQELYGLSNAMVISVVLQIFYVTKFFFWETGYLRSLDIMHDRAGFYICWGCLVWVPAIYTSPAMYLVHHPYHFSLAVASFLMLLGVGSILINYLADRQRQKIRLLSGNCKVWGKLPRLTIAKYTTTKGEIKENLLLASGFWGLARHFHYLPEIIGAFLWTVPALFVNFLPYFYVIFLTALLVDRAFRDDARCALKYGAAWKQHCEKVPYKIIPYVF